MNARRCVVSVVAVVAVAARLPGLFTQSLSQDEVASARIIRQPTFTGLRVHLPDSESTPPLCSFAFTVLAALSWLWLDSSTRAVRRRITVAIGLGALAAAPWLPVTLAQYHQDRFWWIGAFRLRPVLAVPLRLFTAAYTSTAV